MNEKELKITWNQIHNDSIRLAMKIKQNPSNQFDKIIAITRGGMFPALIITEVLNINNVDTICISSYKDMNQEPVKLIKFPIISKKEKWLIVDDLIDTGETIQTIINHMNYGFIDCESIKPECSFGVLYTKPKGLKRKLVDYYVENIGEAWIVFPWEKY